MNISDGFLCSGCGLMPFQSFVVFSFISSVILLFFSICEIVFEWFVDLYLKNVATGVHCDSAVGVNICSIECSQIFGICVWVYSFSIL